MDHSTGYFPGYVYSNEYPPQLQGYTSPAADYPPHVAATSGLSYQYTLSAASGNLSPYHQHGRPSHHAMTTTVPFRPGAVAASSSAEERENKRRTAHSAMERSRRERTNNKINEIRSLIPCIRNEARLQKLEILEYCASYIRELQDKVRDLPDDDVKKRRRLEPQPSPTYSADSHFSHGASPPSLGGRRYSSGSNNSTRRHPQENVAAVTHTRAGTSSFSFGQSTDPAASLETLAAAAEFSSSPLISSTSRSRVYTLADVPAEYWNPQLLSGGMPGLLSPGSNASFKTSSSTSNIEVSRDLPSLTIANESLITTLPLADGESQAKTSIDFLTS
ncbi:hypothetical protein GGI13_000052 [Coemansia sp. RSA 455]|nr:hypothetical protein GGI13_000052 [Coemansia sp. RSA 455]